MLFKNKTCEKCGYKYDHTEERCPDCNTINTSFEYLGIPKTLLWLPWPIQAVLFVTGFAMGGMFLLGIVVSWILAMCGVDYDSGALTFFTNVIVFVILFIWLVGVILLFDKKRLLKHLKDGKQYLYGLLFAVILFVISVVLANIAYKMGAKTNENQSAVNLFFEKWPILSIVVMGIIGPIVEEITYRIGLFTLGRRLNKYAAYAITIVAFALIHFSFDSENIVNELLNLPSYIFAGFLLSFAYEKEGPMCSITAHVTYNTLTLLLSLIPVAK